MHHIKKIFQSLLICTVVSLFMLSGFVYATSAGERDLTDRENAAFIVRDEWTAWVKGFTASLSELDKNATSRIYDNMDFFDMQYRFTEKYKKVPEYLDEDGKPTQKLKDLIKEKRKKIAGAAKVRDYLKFTATENGTTVQYYVNGGLSALSVDLGYSKDGSTFISWQPNTPISLNIGETIYVWNKTNTLSTSSANYIKLITNKNCTVSGNVNSLLNFDDVKPNCFALLFAETSIIDFSNVQLPSMALAENCYYSMFEDADIVYAPELPATSLANNCYSSMFYRCTSLTAAPDLPATTLADSCYSNMFANSGIQTGPDIKATTLAYQCFNNMFFDCSSLNSIKLAYTGNFISNQFNGWVTDVPNTGTFYYSGTDTSNFGNSAIPKDASNHWTVQPYESTNWSSVSALDWMSKIPDSRYLNNINIPGTHDSATKFVYNANSLIMAGKEYARCQELSITDQLRAGVRLLDIRIDASGNLCHGSGTTKFIAKLDNDTDASSTITFASAFNDIKTFLDAHINETIVMSVKVEDGAAADVITAINNVISANPSYFYTGVTFPQLGDVRKKIVLLSRISSFTGGIPVSLPDNTSGNITVDGVQIYCEDHYDVNANTKQGYIDTAFNTTMANDIVINGTKGTSGALIFTSSNVTLSDTPKNIADLVNPHIIGKSLTSGKQLGWVFSDFASEELARKIFSTNP